MGISKQTALIGAILVAGTGFGLGFIVGRMPATKTVDQAGETDTGNTDQKDNNDTDTAAKKPPKAAIKQPAKTQPKPPKPVPPKAQAAQSSTFKATVSDKDPAKGPKDALITIVEFSDFTCGFCSKVLPTLDQIQEKYGNDVRIVFKAAPRNQAGRLPAMAALAAHEHGKFWEMHDKIFAERRGFTRDNLVKWAGELGLDVKAFSAAIDDGEKRYGPTLQANGTLGGQIGARGTPHFFINGQRVRGAQPFANFDSVVTAELAKAKKLVAGGVSKNKLYASIMSTATQDAPKPAAQRRPAPSDKTIYRVPVSKSEPSQGPEDAFVTLVEFSDFTCGYCGKVLPTLEKLKETYGNNLRIVHKVTPRGPNGIPPAYAAMAAHQQGKFWEMHDKIFANRRNMNRESFIKWAGELGLDVDKFTKAFDDGENVLKPSVAGNMLLSKTVGARGTPHFFVNGRKLRGAQPYETFKTVIDEELKKAKEMAASGTPKARIYGTLMAKGKSEEPPKALAAKSTAANFTVDGYPIYGAESAPVTLVEFSDFQCPYCAKFGPVLKQVVDQMPGKVRLVFKQFPLNFHKQARPAARAALAAHRQGKFWKMHDIIFERFRELNDGIYDQFATTIGLDVAKFKADMADPAIEQMVNADVQEGRANGVRGTPTFFINGRRYQERDRSVDAIKKVINEQILKK